MRFLTNFLPESAQVEVLTLFAADLAYCIMSGLNTTSDNLLASDWGSAFEYAIYLLFETNLLLSPSLTTGMVPLPSSSRGSSDILVREMTSPTTHLLYKPLS